MVEVERPPVLEPEHVGAPVLPAADDAGELDLGPGVVVLRLGQGLEADGRGVDHLHEGV